MRWSFLGTCEASAVVSGMGNIDLEVWSGRGEPGVEQQLAEHPYVLTGRWACSLQEEEEEAETREEIPVGSAEKQTWNGTRMSFPKILKMSFKLPMRTVMTLPWPPIAFLAILTFSCIVWTSPTFPQMGSSGSWWVSLSHLQILIH